MTEEEFFRHLAEAVAKLIKFGSFAARVAMVIALIQYATFVAQQFEGMPWSITINL